MACVWLGMGSCFMTAQADEPLTVKFRSRALLDAAVSSYGKESVQGYYRLEDFRVGFKATYRQYEMKADIGLGGNKVAIKDLLLNYYFKHGVLSLGNAYEPYSMDMLISTADMRFHQSAGSVLAFTDGRKLGLTYHSSLPLDIGLRDCIRIMTSIKSVTGRLTLWFPLRGAFGAAVERESVACGRCFFFPYQTGEYSGTADKNSIE